MSRKKLNDRGIVAMTVLWILAILSILSVGLGQQASLELSLVKHEVEKFKGRYAAWGALAYTMDQIVTDSKDDKGPKGDTLYQCAIALQGGETPQKLFEGVALGDAQVNIGYSADINGEGKKFYSGIQDERGRININLINGQTNKMLIELIALSGYDEDTAKTIAYSVLDWRDDDKNLIESHYGAEEDHYSGLEHPYHAKNRPFDSVEEFLLVRGMTPEIFTKIKEYITVYPKQGNMAINLDTAPAIVLRSVARSMAQFTNTSASAADHLVDKLLANRKGADGIEMTADDQLVDPQGMQLSHEEQVILLSMQAYRMRKSDMLRVNVQAKTQMFSRGVMATAVVTRPELGLVYWHRN